MEHLSHEALCRLVDEQPDAAERHHLQHCDDCATELQELCLQTEALGSLPELRPPLGDWNVLQAQLVSEGLVRRPGGVANTLATTPGWMRAAAAIMLFFAGTALGAALARQGPGATAPPHPFALASTIAEAAEGVKRAEQGYIEALVRYQQLAEAEGVMMASTDPAGRFAALDHLVTAGQAAVRQAPADLFLNGFLATAMAERQSMLRQISSGQADGWF